MFLSEVHPFFIGFFLLVLGVLACRSWNQPRAAFALARWSEFVAAPTETPDEFYTKLYTLLRSRLEEKQLPFSSVGFGPRHLFSTRTIFGARPVYLSIKYQHLTYYVYAAPAPNGLFVSSWLFSKYTLWEDHPILKWILVWRLYQQTLFQFDVLELFHGVTHNALTDLVDSYREEQGLLPMNEYEKRPVLHSYYAKMKHGAVPPTAYPASLYPAASSIFPGQALLHPDLTGSDSSQSSTSQSSTSHSSVAGGVGADAVLPIRTDVVRPARGDFPKSGANGHASSRAEHQPSTDE